MNIEEIEYLKHVTLQKLADDQEFLNAKMSNTELAEDVLARVIDNAVEIVNYQIKASKVKNEELDQLLDLFANTTIDAETLH